MFTANNATRNVVQEKALPVHKGLSPNVHLSLPADFKTMHIRLFKWQWVCAYCRISSLDGDHIWLVSESEERFTGPYMVTKSRENCPRQQCRYCQTAPLAYPFHLPCLATLHQLLDGQKLVEDDDWHLRCAQAMAHEPALEEKQPPTPRTLIDALDSSLPRIMKLASDKSPLTSLLQQVRHDLPPELQEQVFSFMSDSPGGSFLFLQKSLDVLEDLCSWPEQRQRSISCHGALFARWSGTEQLPILAGLYEDNVQGSQRIDTDHQSWSFIILQWNASHITSISLVAHESDLVLATTSESSSWQILQRPASDTLWVTMKGLVISHLDSSKQLRHRVLWNTPTPVSWKLISQENPIHKHRYSDVTLTYLALVDVHGISIAHCNTEIKFIHLHRNEHDDSYIYAQVHNLVTWMYCPIDEGEPILGMWLVRHSGSGTGLLVKTPYKTVWLCSNSNPSGVKDLQLLGTPKTRGFYYCSCMQYYGSVPNHPSLRPQVELPRLPNFPTSLVGWRQYQWSLSTASLSNVLAVRRSSQGKGFELRYEKFSLCLGDFRPSHALHWLLNPTHLKVSRVSERRHTVTFYEDGNQKLDTEASPLSGTSIVLWSCQGDSIVEVMQDRLAQSRDRFPID